MAKQRYLPTVSPLIFDDGSGGGGASVFNVVETTTYAAKYNDLVESDASGANTQVDLPAASAASSDGNAVIVKCKPTSLANHVAVHPAGGDTIDDVAGDVLLYAGDFLYFVSDGASNWIVVAQKTPAQANRLTAVKVGAYAAVPGDFVQVDATGGDVPVTLPLAADAGAGAVVEIKNKTLSVNNANVGVQGGDSIDGDAALAVPSLGSARLVSDGVATWMTAP